MFFKKKMLYKVLYNNVIYNLGIFFSRFFIYFLHIFFINIITTYFYVFLLIAYHYHGELVAARSSTFELSVDTNPSNLVRSSDLNLFAGSDNKLFCTFVAIQSISSMKIIVGEWL